MKEVAAADPGQEDDDLEEGSDVSAGYHSDSDSAVMASGNSPFVSKSARYHFLSRSGAQIICFLFALLVTSLQISTTLVCRRVHQLENGRLSFCFSLCPRAAISALTLLRASRIYLRYRHLYEEIKLRTVRAR